MAKKKGLQVRISKPQTNTLLIVGGVVVIGVAALLLLKKKKQDLVVQFQSSDDTEAANIVRKALNPKSFLQGFIDIDTLDADTVFIGGQFANSSVNDLVLINAIPDHSSLGAGDAFIFVGSHRGFNVYVIAGQDVADTVRAANWIKTNKALPTSTIQV